MKRLIRTDAYRMAASGGKVFKPPECDEVEIILGQSGASPAEPAFWDWVIRRGTVIGSGDILFAAAQNGSMGVTRIAFNRRDLIGGTGFNVNFGTTGGSALVNSYVYDPLELDCG